MLCKTLCGTIALVALVACGAQTPPSSTKSEPSAIQAEPPRPDSESRNVELGNLADAVEELDTAKSILTEALTNQPRIDPAIIARLRANKGITLQWISAEDRGSVTVTQNEKGDVILKGEQRGLDNEDFLEIEGRIVATTASSFILLGHIGYDVQHLREFGSPRCDRSGAFTFRITGDRQYYRLLEKTGRCGIQADYVDIYF